MKLFRELDSEEEIAEFKKWARDNYKPFSPIKGIWHPEVQKECAEINKESEIFKESDKDESLG
tara:strand:- start:9014 stop:9202 length:189 start_codon:yes stop_codon:yes gene_type:complete